MNSRKWLQQTFCLALVVLFLTGCLGAQGPKQGRWEGEQPSVSFDVTSDGILMAPLYLAPIKYRSVGQ